MVKQTEMFDVYPKLASVTGSLVSAIMLSYIIHRLDDDKILVISDKEMADAIGVKRGKIKAAKSLIKKTRLVYMWLEGIPAKTAYSHMPKTKPTQLAKPDQIFPKGFVYLMQDKRSGYHKIGFSKNPKYREVTLQAQEPLIELIVSWPGTIRDERHLHLIYIEKRIRGEWFDLSQSDVNFIKNQVN